MPSLSFTGLFLAAKPTELVGQKNFAVRSFYIDITTNPDDPNTPELRLKGDKVNLVDNLTKGTAIEVYINIEGKRVAKRDGSGDIIINEISVWKIDVLQKQSAATVQPRTQPAQAAAPAPQRPTASHMPTGAAAFADAGNGDDLPF